VEELYAIDIETTGLSSFKDRILGIGVYSPSFNRYFSTVADFSDWLRASPNVVFVAHNGSFDVTFLKRAGVDVTDRWRMDTRSLASILVPRPISLGLEHLAEIYLGQAPYKLDRTKMAEHSPDEVRDYCLKDCELTYELFQLFRKQLSGESWKFVENWLMPATFFCAAMEYDGVYVDERGLKVYRDEMVAKRDQILTELKERAKNAIIAYHEQQVIEVRKTYKELYEKAKTKTKDQTKCLRRYALLESAAVSRLEPFNWNSPQQLIWLLKDYYQLDITDRDGDSSTSEAVLKRISHPVCEALCRYREAEKLVSTCIPALLENIQEDGFVHTHYHIGGTRTGRLSSSGPNLQQIPRGRLRSYVRAFSDSRVLATIDYSQIEVRIIAEVAKERELINAFKEGIDPYSVIAHKLLKIDCDIRLIKEKFKKERDVSKTAGLSILYGTGAGKLQEVLNKELNKDYSLEECRRFIRAYRDSFPAIKQFKQDLERKLANKKVYHNLLGRPFTIEDNEDLYMKSLNTLVQGSASDLVLHSAIKVKQKLQDLGVPAKCRLLIHDEQVWELPEDEAELLVNEVIVPAMTLDIEKELRLTVPLKVEYTISREWCKP
jgi:DNA polymerase-1